MLFILINVCFLINLLNKNGLKFLRNISFDENFMITVEDEVLNQSQNTVELTNFSYIRRKNHIPENKFFILHEGPLGVFNDTLKEISYDKHSYPQVIFINTGQIEKKKALKSFLSKKCFYVIF